MFDQHPYAYSESIVIAGAGTVSSVGLTPANRPLDALSVEMEVNTPAMTQNFDVIVQTAPAGVAAGGNWKNCTSSVVRKQTTTSRVSIIIRDPLLAQVRLQVVQNGNGTFTGNIRWLGPRNLVTAES